MLKLQMNLIIRKAWIHSIKKDILVFQKSLFTQNNLPDVLKKPAIKSKNDIFYP